MYRYYKQELSFPDAGMQSDSVRSKSAGWPPAGLPLVADELPTVAEGAPPKQSLTRAQPSHVGPPVKIQTDHKRTSRPGTPQALGVQDNIFENAGGDTGSGVPKIFFNRRTLNFVIMLPDGEMLEGRIFNVFLLHVDNPTSRQISSLSKHLSNLQSRFVFLEGK